MNPNYKRLLANLALVSVGLAVNGVGTALTYWAGIGANPFATFVEGLSLLLHISVGTATVLANVLSLAPVLFAARDVLRGGTFLCAFTAGFYIDGAGWVLAMLPRPAAFPLQVLTCLAGILLIGVGLSLYVAADIGLGAVEALVEVCQRATHWQYRSAKWLVDACFFVIGMLLGASIGVATVLNLLLLGVVMQFFIPVFVRMLARWRGIEEPGEQGPVLDSADDSVIH